MGDNAVNEIIMQDDIEDLPQKEVNSFSDAIKELGKLLHTNYQKRNTNLSLENINGIIIAESINEYTERNFKYRYNILDKLIAEKQERMVSHNGYSIEKTIEIVKGISATFEQTQIPQHLRDLINRR